ncbi:M3 family metallopeptidase [Nafulsella turpanensis]|uniref:M3 family metallopeptidase n=1 Tax=Nafulsella turpanensis TaxID=1265690 RepID=UPI0003496BB5|nr:M3 family metallopeptidase [Nafulsella turpanensis]
MNSIKSMATLAAAGVFLWACSPEVQQETPPEVNNPFFTTYNTPFEVPPFEQIKNEHFKPAIEEGIRRHAAEIEAIANAEEAPTFENTIAAMDTAGALLDKVTSVFYPLSSANTNDSIQAIAKEVAPLLSAHSDNIRLNPELFARVKAVWDKKDQLQLDEEQQMLLEDTYKSFVRSGANLSEADKEKLRGINEELSVLSLQFGQNVLDETNNYQLVIEKEEDLAGLPAGLVENAAAEAKEAGMEGKWIFTLHNPSVMPFLQYADNRELRKEIWNAYQMRGNNNNEFDNKEIIRKMANLRMERAQLLGYDTHADYVLEESMAKTPENVYKLLDQLWAPALQVAKQEAKDMQKMINASGENFELAPYDWRYYTEKIRKQRYDLNAEEIKPYFSLDAVKEGAFSVTNKLYGLTFEELKDIPKYHEDVTAYEVKEADGTHVGVLYMDFFPRESKRGGAWMTSYRSQQMEDGKRKAPVISIVGNFSKPTEGAPALLTFDEVSTFFHEFGHALHGLLSDVKYESLAGTNVPRDFVELPSQIMENWASEPEVMKMYGKHYKTGETIPDELIEKMKAAGTFNQGFATTEYLAASLLDLNYHTLEKPLTGEVKDFEEASMNKIGLIEEIIPRYRSTYFNHIFAGGYSSGYYSYIWSGVLDSDAYQAFKEKSLFDPELAKSFRENVLERGGTREPMEMYVDFRGREPDIQPLLEKRGLDKLGKTNIEGSN